jgi:hypothetical protein
VASASLSRRPSSGPERVGEPSHEKHRGFEDEAVVMRQHAQPIEQSIAFM